MEITAVDTIILSLVQGVTEFLPISSSGHLVLAPVFFGFADPGLAFSAGLHFGTLGAVVAYFWRDVISIVKSLCGVCSLSGGVATEAVLPCNIAWLLLVATIPAAMAGFFLEDFVAGMLRAPVLVGSLIFAGSVLLWRVDRYKRARAEVITAVTYKDALWFGILQAIAIIPGISRSGMTIVAGRALGFSRHASARFSFLMAIPIILGATILEIPDVVTHGLTAMLVMGMMVSFVAAYITIAFFLRFVEHIPFWFFVWYSVVLLVITMVV